MMSKVNQTPHCLANSSFVLRLVLVLLAASAIGAQSRIVKPPQTNANSNSGKRAHIATVRATDSSEGSRVAISSDQSLNDYEAYRRGDRFYVKIPATDVPRAEAVRGRGFVDVTAQKTGASTILSFRLQPGATAHVEQRANKLDVVVSVPGGAAVASNRTKEVVPSSTTGSRGSDSAKRTGVAANANKNPAKNLSSNNSSKPPAVSNSNRAANTASTAKAAATAKPTQRPIPSESPKSSATAKPSPTAKPSLTPAKSVLAASSPTATPANGGNLSQGDWWTRLKERGHYWILLAQLNPIPVALGAGLLLLVIGLLLFQRRRARATRRAKPSKIKSKTAPATAAVVTSAAPTASPAAAEQDVIEPSPTPEEKAAEAVVSPTVAVPSPAPAVASSDEKRRERVSRATEESKKLFAGESFDESVLGSEDRETRRLVCAELSSALVGRSPERRHRAREAFMKYGYFDDATRDLRVAESENERAAAARRLSFVQDREATPHLVGALSDTSPDVRRAAIEALMDLRDPEAIAPLNSLLQTETDRKVPRNLITQAIEACATAAPESASTATSQPTPSAVPEFVSNLPQPTPPSFETEREVIEL